MSGTLKGRLSAGYFAGIVLLAVSSGFSADTLISPDNPAINYYGRFDFSNPKAPRFNWSGSTIEFLVSETATVGMELTDGVGYYDIEIDGTAQSTPEFADSWNSKKYVLVASLQPGSHVIRIIRRNEPYWAIATLGGIYLSSGGKILPLAKPVRKMEFCGDSWTAGYFVEDCTDQQSKTNANKAWARLASKAFKAQDVIMAESGIGLVKSLGGKASFPKKYTCTFDTIGGIPTPLWNFTVWIPDIVSIFLGINDKSSGATDNEYIAAVHSFVNIIRGNYPNAPILFISQTGMMDAATQTAVAAETTSIGHKGIYFLESKTPVTGCSWHPTPAENKEIADAVVTRIKQITGWDTTVVAAANDSIRHGKCQTARLTIAHIDSRTLRITARQKEAGLPILIAGANGRIVKKLRLDPCGSFSLNTAQIPDGIYYVGCVKTGWKSVLVKR